MSHGGRVVGGRGGELHGGEDVLTVAVPADTGMRPPPIGHRAAHRPRVTG